MSCSASEQESVLKDLSKGFIIPKALAENILEKQGQTLLDGDGEPVWGTEFQFTEA